MKREIFCDNFNYHFKPIDNNYYLFHVDIHYQKEHFLLNKISEHFLDYFLTIDNSIDTEQIKNIFSTLNLNKRFDDDYVEENPDNDLVRYLFKININELYDNFCQYLDKEITTIYRIETEKGQGLYSSKFASLKVGDNHPCPRSDPLLNTIFNHNSFSSIDSYDTQWQFGFDNLEDLREWLGNEADNIRFIIKEIQIFDNFVIRGNKQLIMKKNEIISKINIYDTTNNTLPIFKKNKLL